jgi:tetratricopeptide (TPR) repeat protein
LTQKHLALEIPGSAATFSKECRGGYNLAQIFLSIGLLVGITLSASAQEQNTSDFYIQRGTMLWRHADYQGGISSYTRAIEIDEAIVQVGQANQADLERLASTYLTRARVRRVVRAFDGAFADIDRALQIHPGWAQAHYECGFTHQMAHDPGTAVTEYTKAIDINPKYAAAYKDRGHSRNDLGDWKGALGDFDTSIEINPTDAQAYFFRGGTRENHLDYAGALADFTKMIELAPDNPGSYKIRGLFFLFMGRDSDAERDLAKCIQLNPAEKPAIEEILNRVRKARKARQD